MTGASGVSRQKEVEMEIGDPKPARIFEPVEDPFAPPAPKPDREPVPEKAPVKVPEPEKVPA
jgi:hypothetical protein